MPAGRNILHVPVASNMPDRVLHAIDMPVFDHRGPAFAELRKTAPEGME